MIAMLILIQINLVISYIFLDLVKVYEQARSKQVPHWVGPNRTGDIASCYAYPTLAMLGWRSDNILNTRYWQSQMPQGKSGD